ncbi:unnamed protein product [Eruca vesicaria subsp. sativa]|uniref:Uncharacterized protein n=1 Tax=Eruca vesicaria subsp. sativa TaxID=29727 RepID=A0ABC8K4D3_ERUVS|nr:unnamed protein product [Eruca vesicaria subsp. sativa]
MDEINGNRIEGVDDVPLLSWRGSRPRINFSDFCAQEKRKYQKVRVRHMVFKPMEDRYPKWKDDKVFTDLDNMIEDILNDQLDENFWEVMADSRSRKRKSHVSPPLVPDTNDVSPSTKRKKVEEHVDRCHTSETVEAHNMAIIGLVDLQAKVDARIGLYETESKKKIAMLEEELKNLKQQHGVHIPTEVAKSNGVNSFAQEEDDASSNALSWMLEKKINSQDGLPIQCVVKKEKQEKKTIEKQEYWEQHLQWKKSEKCRLALDAFALNVEESTHKQKPKLTKTQVWPYEGNSTVKRIIPGACRREFYLRSPTTH